MSFFHEREVVKYEVKKRKDIENILKKCKRGKEYERK